MGMPSDIYRVGMILMILASMNGSGATSNCSLWLHDNGEGKCHCGNSLDGTILCLTTPDGQAFLFIKRGNCMTTDDHGKTLVSFCIFNIQALDDHHFSMYTRIQAKSASYLSKEFCEKYSRTGLSCERCIHGYGLPAFSYSLSCIKCTYYSYDWAKYIAAVYIPLTVFFFVIIVFRVSVTSGPMVGLVIISQIISTPRLVRYDLVKNRNTFMKIIVSVYSVWNLDLFREIVPSLCLNSKFNYLHILLLEYAIAVYPMILLLATYVLVELQDRLKLIRILFRPVQQCLHYFRKEWDIRSSLIHSFASVLVLAYSKILDTSISLLMPTYLYDIHGTTKDVRVYYHPSILYRSSLHLPYFVVAIVMLILFNILPLLILLLYPLKSFHKLLITLNLQNRYLHTFMDALVGCYTHKPRDLRFFPALLLMLQFARILVSGIFGAPPYVYTPISNYMLLTIFIMLFLIRPFKVNWHNWINTFLFLCGFLYALSNSLHLESYVINTPQKSHILHQVLFSILPIVFGIIPPVYSILRCIVVFTPSNVKKVLYKAFTACRTENLDSSSLPHRLHSSQEQCAFRQHNVADSDNQ